MKKQLFNSDWYFTDGSGGGLAAQINGLSRKQQKVELPHDAMIHEQRSPGVESGSQSGFYPGGIYQYTKNFFVPEEWKERTVVFEFEGVYAHAMVYINGDYAGGCLYGYSNFYVLADEFLKYGEENEIRVTANNSMQPNSRWYSGSGIYRSVNLFTGGMLRIPVNGIRITVKDIRSETAMAEIEVKIENDRFQGKRIKVQTEILDPDGKVTASDETVVTVYKGDRTTVCQRILLPAPRLWDCDSPELYTARISLVADQETEDCVEEHFGIREISVDPVNGFCLNGKTLNLRGSCIHHDNGIIGAATYACAEERRCRQLKEAGFNCIRSSHHPMGKAMLDACDRLGMLVMDELSDMWTRSKNTNDYAQEFIYHWEDDVRKIVDKDYNHPCVVFYSTGNEIQEAGTAKGAQMNRRISDAFKKLDGTRFTTSAANGLIAASSSMKEIMTDVLREAGIDLNESGPGESGDAGGSNLLNNMMSLVMSGPTGDAFSAHPRMTEHLEEFADATDIAGYNYLTGRHALEHQLNPNRVVLGTETFPGDIVRLWNVVKNNSHVIGDMTWTGYDYLGEAGCGIFYYDGKMNFSSNWPDRAAYIGDIDIIGYRRPISYLRQIVFGLRKAPYIAVDRIDRYGQPHSMTPWMFKDNIASWTWSGYEGKPTNVDVYSASEEVELFLNGKSLGRKPAGETNGYTASYEIAYQPGELKAIGYSGGEADGEDLLQTADENVLLVPHADSEKIRADSQELIFLTVGLEDALGRQNLHAEKMISVHVEGPGILQGFGNADPKSEKSYDETEWPTYDGFVLAVIRSTGEKGKIEVTFNADGCAPAKIEIMAE